MKPEKPQVPDREAAEITPEQFIAAGIDFRLAVTQEKQKQGGCDVPCHLIWKAADDVVPPEHPKHGGGWFFPMCVCNCEEGKRCVIESQTRGGITYYRCVCR